MRPTDRFGDPPKNACTLQIGDPRIFRPAGNLVDWVTPDKKCVDWVTPTLFRRLTVNCICRTAARFCHVGRLGVTPHYSFENDDTRCCVTRSSPCISHSRASMSQNPVASCDAGAPSAVPPPFPRGALANILAPASPVHRLWRCGIRSRFRFVVAHRRIET